MHHHLRVLVALLIATACIAATIKLFDWHAAAVTASQIHVKMLVEAATPLLLAIFSLRGWRWLIVLGMTPNRRLFWQSFYANGVAAGLASITPLQIGEVIKLRIVPDDRVEAWQIRLSGFFLERTLDLSALIGVGLCGLAIHFDIVLLAPIAMLLPLWSGLTLWAMSSQTSRLPLQWQPYLQSMHCKWRVVSASILTVFVWLLYASLWWIAVAAIDVRLDFNQICILLGSVMLAVVASLTPGGLGVAELGSRGVMLWLGASTQEAEAIAIALRALTPLIMLAGALCSIPVLRCKFGSAQS